MLNRFPRIIIAALKGGSGKTILSLGLAAAWLKKGFSVAPFKKGPDFIDAGWLAFAAGRSCHNLDPFLMTRTQVVQSFLLNADGADVSLIEGNRGLFDGLDREGCCSTAELGRWLESPLILIVDVTMTTRTVAALIMGCQRFDPDLKIVGAILNRVAGSRQQALIRDAVEHYCGIPVIGSVPKLKNNIFPERHMGLIPHQERDHAKKAVAWAKGVAEDNLEVDAIWRLAHGAAPLEGGTSPPEAADQGRLDASPTAKINCDPPRIGVVRDNAFWFYYPENLDQLKNLGAVLVEVNSLSEKTLPELDALYIGGGFPETQAEALADNVGFRESLKNKIETGLPVYAECGGLMYLAESLVVDGKVYPMAGALPLTCVLEKKPQGHGYTVMKVTRPNPYYPVGEILKGHEFHYSRPVINRPEEIDAVFEIQRGRGLDGKIDGLCKKNLLATYTHVHAAGYSMWGRSFFEKAHHYMVSKKANFFKRSKKSH